MTTRLNRTVVFHLTDSSWDGKWMDVPADRTAIEVFVGGPHSGDDPPPSSVAMVPTGNLEWYDNRAAEVWVPEHRLPLWRAEHDLPSDEIAWLNARLDFGV